jgi:hypothetical protein
MRRKLGLALGLVAIAVAMAVGLVVAVVGLAGSDEPAAWKELSTPPLSPRETPTGFWTGEVVMLVGGSDAPPCPPTAACTVPKVAPVADGAAYDPATGAWRAIADAPVGFSWAEPELIDGSAYLWIAGENGRPNAPSAFLAYRIGDDRWDELEMPTADPGWYTILRAGKRIVAHTYDDSEGERPDFVFDTTTSTWSELPDDPFEDPYSRELAWDGDRLLLFDHQERDESVDAAVRGASFDFASGEWQIFADPDSKLERLPEPEQSPRAPELEPTAEGLRGDDGGHSGGGSIRLPGLGVEHARGQAALAGWLWSPE